MFLDRAVVDALMRVGNWNYVWALSLLGDPKAVEVNFARFVAIRKCLNVSISPISEGRGVFEEHGSG